MKNHTPDATELCLTQDVLEWIIEDYRHNEPYETQTINALLRAMDAVTDAEGRLCDAN